jgi:DNA-binding transcriptional LysR family regulator
MATGDVGYTLDQLRGFVAVAEESHFGRAAERLRMTQPPLSRQVQRLERAVGFDLFLRTPRGAELTPAGRIFLEEARRLLSSADTAPLRARRVAAGTAGTIRIGFTAVSALTVLGRWIAVAAAELPGVDLVLSEMVTHAQLDALLAGEIEVGLVRQVPRSDLLDSRLVATDSLILAAPRGHALTLLGRAPTLTEIAEHDVVTYSPSEAWYFYELVVAAFQGERLSPRYVQHISQVHTVLSVVNAGLGVALVPSSATALNLANLSFSAVEGLPGDTVELHAVWRNRHGNPALNTLLDRVLGASRGGMAEAVRDGLGRFRYERAERGVVHARGRPGEAHRRRDRSGLIEDRRAVAAAGRVELAVLFGPTAGAGLADLLPQQVSVGVRRGGEGFHGESFDPVLAVVRCESRQVRLAD